MSRMKSEAQEERVSSLAVASGLGLAVAPPLCRSDFSWGNSTVRARVTIGSG